MWAEVGRGTVKRSDGKEYDVVLVQSGDAVSVCIDDTGDGNEMAWYALTFNGDAHIERIGGILHKSFTERTGMKVDKRGRIEVR